LNLKEGPAAMLGAAVVGGIILAMIEGIGLGLSRISGQMMLNEQCKYNIFMAKYCSYLLLNTFLILKSKRTAAIKRKLSLNYLQKCL
jgi:hypothetical protein